MQIINFIINAYYYLSLLRLYRFAIEKNQHVAVQAKRFLTKYRMHLRFHAD